MPPTRRRARGGSDQGRWAAAIAAACRARGELASGRRGVGGATAAAETCSQVVEQK